MHRLFATLALISISLPTIAEFRVVEGSLWNKEQMGTSAIIENDLGERYMVGSFFMLEDMDLRRNPNFAYSFSDTTTCQVAESVVHIQLNNLSMEFYEHCQFNNNASRKMFMYIPKNAYTSMVAFKEIITSQNHLSLKTPKIQTLIPMEGFNAFWKEINQNNDFTLLHENEWDPTDMGAFSSSVFASKNLRIESITGFTLFTDKAPEITLLRESFPSKPCVPDQLNIVSINNVPVKMETLCPGLDENGFGQIYYMPSTLKGRNFIIQSLLESESHIDIEFSEFSAKLTAKGFKEQHDNMVNAL